MMPLAKDISMCLALVPAGYKLVAHKKFLMAETHSIEA